MKTPDFDAQRKQLHEEYLALLRVYAGELASAIRALRERRAAEKLTHADVDSGLRMLGLGLARVGQPAELRDGDDKPAPPPKPGARLKKLRIVG